MWYVYVTEYYSVIKRMNNAMCSDTMDLEMIILSEVRQSKTNIIWYHLHVG